jgi:hypothetical protein
MTGHAATPGPPHVQTAVLLLLLAGAAQMIGGLFELQAVKARHKANPQKKLA